LQEFLDPIPTKVVRKIKGRFSRESRSTCSPALRVRTGLYQQLHNVIMDIDNGEHQRR
jgi:hypothetical protein